MANFIVTLIQLSLFLPIPFSTSTPSSRFSSYASCFKMCHCSLDKEGRVNVRCSLAESNFTAIDIQLPTSVYSLDLSNNSLFHIPASLFHKYKNITKLILDDNELRNLTTLETLVDFPSLEHLSVQRNSIKFVESNFFRGLNRLKYLNLRLNNVERWSGKQSNNTPALELLDITGTIRWVPDKNILALPKIKELRGVTWCKFCPNCNVINPRNLVNESERKLKAERCLEEFDRMKYLIFGKTEPKTFIERRFLPECMCVKQSECEFRHVVMPYFKRRTSLPQQLFYMEYFLSPLTILLNLVVILIVLTSRSLRATPSFILICHTAIIDLLIGIYAIWVANTNISHINGILEEIMWTGKKLQPSTGPIFISGQLISVSISLLLTLERYLAVVYCVAPSKRMTAKGAHISLSVAWGMAITFAILPILGVGGLHYNIRRACTPLSYDEEFDSGSSLILVTSLTVILLLYFATVPLYILLFRFVKKSSNQVGVKRELSLAKKIALLVFTNFVFFAIPMLLILLFSVLANLESNPFDFEGDPFKSTVFKIAIGQCLPVTCLNINSLLDPFLYAFRHTHFKREIRRKVNRLFSSKIFPSLAPTVIFNSYGDSKAVPPEAETKKTKTEKVHAAFNKTDQTTANFGNEDLEFNDTEK